MISMKRRIIIRRCGLCDKEMKIELDESNRILTPVGYWKLPDFEYWECEECLERDRKMLENSDAFRTRSRIYKERREKEWKK